MMNQIFKILTCVLIFIQMQGCATVITGQSQEMTFNSEPDDVTVAVIVIPVKN